MAPFKSGVGTVYCRRVRQATDDEVKRWQDDGWVLIEGLVGTDEIDAALEDVHIVFPTAEQYHADPEGETLRRRGRPPQKAWLFPDRSGVFQTTDGGNTWSTVTGLARNGLVGGGSGNIVFVDADHGWVCEVGAGLWRTTDGVHWRHLGS